MISTLSVQEIKVESHLLSADGGFPNNPGLPLLVYRHALELRSVEAADQLERLFRTHGWGGTWRNGVFGYHHFHSNAHELLSVCAGRVKIQFGGPSGPVVEVEAGDVAVLPAGTAHKRVEASADLLVVGAYPAGQEDYDILRGDPFERAEAEERIAKVALPDADPVYGGTSPLLERWKED